MNTKKNVKYIRNKVLKEIYEGAMNIFCQGIAIPSNNHPCGWDWLDFRNIDIEEDILTYKFDSYDISDGIYRNHEYEGLTLKEILIKTKGKFLFEINCYVDWGEDEIN